MRWLVVGSQGMLGTDLLTVLRARGEEVHGVDRPEVDIVDARASARLADGVDVVVNCAAYTAVDKAEEEEPAAFAVNAVGAANVARAARTAGARLVHISTDYVFDGSATSPYPEDGTLAPRSAYGRTKAAGEWAVRAEAPDHLIVRTAWLYGAHGPCFPKKIAQLARERGGLTVIEDQVGQPTWTMDLAGLLVSLVTAGAAPGVYHGTSSGSTSWHGFARAVVAAAGMDPMLVRPTVAAAFASAAERPAYSVLGHHTLLASGVTPIGPWEERWSAAADEVLGAAPPIA